jgi:hypothetical protein
MSEAEKQEGLNAISTDVDEYETKKKYVMTEARAENLRKAREKAQKLRQELKELKPKPVSTRKPSKIEQELEALKAKYKTPEEKTEPDNKEPHVEPIAERTDNEPVDKPVAEREPEDVRSVERKQPTKPKREVGKKPVPDRPAEPVVKKEEPVQEVKPEPKPEPKIELPKPPLYRREGGFLFM